MQDLFTRWLAGPAVAWCVALSPVAAEDLRKEDVVRLPDLPPGLRVKADSASRLFLNVNAKGELLVPGETKPLAGGDATKWVQTAFRSLPDGGRGARLVLRVDRDAAPAAAVELISASGLWLLEIRGREAGTGGDLQIEQALLFGRSAEDPKKLVTVSLTKAKTGDGKGEWLVTEPGKDPTAVEPAKLTERLKPLAAKSAAVAVSFDKAWPWSAAVQALAACHEAGFKDVAFVR